MPLFTHGHTLLIGVSGDLPNAATDSADVAKILINFEHRAIWDGLDVLTKNTTTANSAAGQDARSGLRQSPSPFVPLQHSGGCAIDELCVSLYAYQPCDAFE